MIFDIQISNIFVDAYFHFNLTIDDQNAITSRENIILHY